MPGMDGIELLGRVRERFPRVARVVLSGQVDSGTILSALVSGVARTYFTKPWDDDDLRHRLEHLLLKRRELEGSALHVLVESLPPLPPVPRIYGELRDAIAEGRSLVQVARIIEQDVALAGKVLQTINSAVYARSGVVSVERAITMLGMDAVRRIALFMFFVEGLRWDDAQRRRLDAITTHGVAVQRGAALLRAGSKEEAETAGTAGLFHDVGQVLLLRYFPDRYEATATMVEENPAMGFREAEDRLGWGESSHARLGAHLLDSWNFPETVVETVLWHHDPGMGGSNPALGAVSWVDAAAAAVRRGGEPAEVPAALVEGPASPRLRAELLKILGVGGS
jgi:putative nucleotidyltransferase with HDIG domain